MISSNQNERVKYWASLKNKKNRDEAKEYVIEGEHLVNEAYKYGYLKTVIFYDNLNNKYENIELVEVSKNVIEKISSTSSPQKILGIVKYFDEDVKEIPNKIVLLDGVQDPGNAGTIVRNSLAFGYNLVFFSNDSVDIYNSKFIRATQGYFYSLKIMPNCYNAKIYIAKTQPCREENSNRVEFFQNRQTFMITEVNSFTESTVISAIARFNSFAAPYP